MSKLEEMVRLLFYGFPVYRDYVKSVRMSCEFLEKYHSNDDLRYVITGSFREGFPDIIFSDSDWMVLLNPSAEILTLETQSKVIQSVAEAPAHVKLIIPSGYREYFEEKYPTISTFLGLLKTDEDSCFVSAEEARRLHERDFLHEFMAEQKPSAPYTTPPTDTEGKISVAYTFRSPLKRTGTHGRLVETDRVPAIECMGWPNEANEWKIRKPRNWPRADVVKNITTDCFMIVPKPSDLSGDTKKEWRISFSIPEAKLFECFNEDQAKVYFLLRSLYARHLKEKLEGILSSYHIKTAMFWTLEEEEPSAWSEESTLELFFRVLKKLLGFLKDGYCPHYFIPNHNLCYKTSKKELENAASEITCFLRDPLAFFEELVNPTFLGLLPRPALLSMQVKGKLEKKILRLPTSAAYASFNDPEAHRDLELKCLSETLEETAASIRGFPNGVALIEVFIEALLQGHHFAFTVGKSEADLAKIKLSSVQEDFLVMDTSQMNQSLLVWMVLGKIAVDFITQGTSDKLYHFFFKIYALFMHQDDLLTDEKKKTMDILQTLCCATGAFLATVDFTADKVSYQQLHALLCEILPLDESSAQPPCNITLVLFILGSATCKMAKSFLE